jgi:hypothetical protein
VPADTLLTSSSEESSSADAPSGSLNRRTSIRSADRSGDEDFLPHLCLGDDLPVSEPLVIRPQFKTGDEVRTHPAGGEIDKFHRDGSVGHVDGGPGADEAEFQFAAFLHDFGLKRGDEQLLDFGFAQGAGLPDRFFGRNGGRGFHRFDCGTSLRFHSAKLTGESIRPPPGREGGRMGFERRRKDKLRAIGLHQSAIRNGGRQRRVSGGQTGYRTIHNRSAQGGQPPHCGEVREKSHE